MNNKSAVILKNVSKSYYDGNSKNIILKNANFEIIKGSYNALIGRSGLGKSTILKLIGSLEKSDEGNIIIEDKDLADIANKQLIEVRRNYIGFVFQHFNLINRLSIHENLELPMIFSGLNSIERKKRVANILELLGLSKKSSAQNISSLSGGEKQRIAIGRAIINNPKIVLADEPTGSLDDENEQSILNLFKNINENLGVTLLVVTHSSTVASAAKSRITIKDKQICYCV